MWARILDFWAVSRVISLSHRDLPQSIRDHSVTEVSGYPLNLFSLIRWNRAGGELKPQMFRAWCLWSINLRQTHSRIPSRAGHASRPRLGVFLRARRSSAWAHQSCERSQSSACAVGAQSSPATSLAKVQLQSTVMTSCAAAFGFAPQRSVS